MLFTTYITLCNHYYNYLYIVYVVYCSYFCESVCTCLQNQMQTAGLVHDCENFRKINTNMKKNYKPLARKTKTKQKPEPASLILYKLQS